MSNMMFKTCLMAATQTGESPTTLAPVKSRLCSIQAAGSALTLLFAVLTGCATRKFTVDSALVGAGKGDPEAQYFMGRCYAKGGGVPQDDTKAAEYLRQSAAQGYAKAQNDLGTCHAQGLGVPRDYVEAVTWFRLAAEQGDPLAEYSLGMSYALGRGVPTNMVEAVKWYELAAGQHQIDAILALGDLHLGGRGIRPDYRAACRWYKKAAARNSVQAINALGFIYEQGGFGVAQDAPQAVKYYRQAAAAGDAKGQMNLGRMYLDGIGVQTDCVEAYKWFYLASRNGAGMARHYLDELGGKAAFGDFAGTPLTEEQINEAMRRAEEYKTAPRHL